MPRLNLKKAKKFTHDLAFKKKENHGSCKRFFS
jgi:hypothetical protein